MVSIDAHEYYNMQHSMSIYDIRFRNIGRNLQTSKALLKRKDLSTSLFTSAASNHSGCPNDRLSQPREDTNPVARGVRLDEDRFDTLRYSITRMSTEPCGRVWHYW